MENKKVNSLVEKFKTKTENLSNQIEGIKNYYINEYYKKNNPEKGYHSLDAVFSFGTYELKLEYKINISMLIPKSTLEMRFMFEDSKLPVEYSIYDILDVIDDTNFNCYTFGYVTTDAQIEEILKYLWDTFIKYKEKIDELAINEEILKKLETNIQEKVELLLNEKIFETRNAMYLMHMLELYYAVDVSRVTSDAYIHYTEGNYKKSIKEYSKAKLTAYEKRLVDFMKQNKNKTINYEVMPKNLNTTCEARKLKKPKKELLNIINERTFDDRVLFEVQSDFHDIKVVENEIGKFLHYCETYQAGFINTDFYKGNLPYINYFLIPAIINPKIEKILLIGLGSGKIVNDLEYLLPDLKTFDVVDLEENIVSIAQDYFDFKSSDKFNFILQDGLTYLRNNKKKYDLIIVDVANNDGIDLRFLSDEYFKSIKKSLKTSGMFVSNMCASPDFKNKKNLFFNEYFPVYKQYFTHNHVFKGDYSDEVYYKSFFNIDERVIDITNVIIISTDKFAEIKSNKEIEKRVNDLKVDIQKYLKDLYL